MIKKILQKMYEKNQKKIKKILQKNHEKKNIYS